MVHDYATPFRNMDLKVVLLLVRRLSLLYPFLIL